VDLGIIVDACVILVENIFRNYQMKEDDQREFLRNRLAQTEARNWSERLQMIFASGLQSIMRCLTRLQSCRGVRPLLPMQGVEGQIFNSMARTYATPLAGAIDRDLYRTPGCSRRFCSPSAFARPRQWAVMRCVRFMNLFFAGRFLAGPSWSQLGVLFLGWPVFVPAARDEFLPHLEEGTSGSGRRCRRRYRWNREPPSSSGCARYCAATRSHHRGSQTAVPATAAIGGLLQRGVFVPLKPMDQWTPGLTKKS